MVRTSHNHGRNRRIFGGVLANSAQVRFHAVPGYVSQVEASIGSRMHGSLVENLPRGVLVESAGECAEFHPELCTKGNSLILCELP